MDQQVERIWTLMARKLSGEATPEELAELDLLLVKNPQDNYSFEVLLDVWNSKPGNNAQYAENKYKEMLVRMQQLGIDADQLAAENDFIQPDSSNSRRPRRKTALFLTSIILLGLVIGFSVRYFKKEPALKIAADPVTVKEISTKYGTKTSMLLPDGTEVHLNAGSKLTYDKNYGSKLREVNLTGEAYFDVVKNPQKPFVIHTNTINIRVLGTAFNVRCYPDEKITETSLIRGSLEVSLKNGGEKIILKPNEKIRVNNNMLVKQGNEMIDKKEFAVQPKKTIELGHVSLLPQDNSVIETSWVNNRLVFRSESFESVAQKMEKWYGVEITFHNESLKNKKLTGIFENETIYQALDALKYTTAFKYKVSNDQIILSN